MNPEDLARERWKPVRKAVEERNRLAQELTETNEHLTKLQAELPQAERADREDYAAAIAAGKPEPERRVEQITSTVEAAERRAEAVRLALENADGEIRMLRGEHRSAWRKATFGMIVKKRRAYEEAIRRLAQSREELADEVALDGWLTDGIGVSPVVDALSSRNTVSADGRPPLSFTEVLRSLNEDADEISTHLRELEPRLPWKRIKEQVEARQAQGLSREEALQQVSPGSDWG